MNPQKGDVVVLAHARLVPQYLNGAKVKITGEGRVRRGVQTFEGELLELEKRPRNGRFRAGRPVAGITPSVIHEVIWKEHLEGRYAA